MKRKNPHAVALAKLGKGKPKTLTSAEQQRRVKLAERNRSSRKETL